jgi:hypothetical protein
MNENQTLAVVAQALTDGAGKIPQVSRMPRAVEIAETNIETNTQKTVKHNFTTDSTGSKSLPPLALAPYNLHISNSGVNNSENRWARHAKPFGTVARAR